MRATVRSRSTRQIGRLRVAAAGAPGNTPSITAPDHDAVNGACTRATSAVPGTARGSCGRVYKGPRPARSGGFAASQRSHRETEFRLARTLHFSNETGTTICGTARPGDVPKGGQRWPPNASMAHVRATLSARCTAAPIVPSRPSSKRSPPGANVGTSHALRTYADLLPLINRARGGHRIGHTTVASGAGGRSSKEHGDASRAPVGILAGD